MAMSPILLPDNVKALPIGHLHLETEVDSALDRAGVNTIGRLIDAMNTRFVEVKWLAAKAESNVQKAITALMESMDEDNSINWNRFWESQSIKLLPPEYEPHSSPDQIIKLLPKVIKVILCSPSNDDRRWEIIQRRFGLDNTQRLNQERLGKALRISATRVGKLEGKALQELREVLIQNDYGGRTYHVQSEPVC